MYRIFDRISEIAWDLKGKYTAILSAIIVVLGGVGIGWGLRGGETDPVREEVRGAIVLLRGDFAAGSIELGGTYNRHFRGEKDGGIVGEVTRKVEKGACWGFDVVFPKDWLISGEGEILVGEERKFPAEMCR